MTIAELEQFRAPRPRRADGARNFDAIVLAARAAFRRDGADVALEAIADAAGVGIATLYRNFPTRESLIQHLYIDEIESIVADAQAVEGLEPWPALLAWMHRFADRIGAKNALATTLDPSGDVYEACTRTIIATALPIVERARAAGELDPGISESDLTRGVYGIATMPVDSETQRHRVLDALMAGMRRG
ncbi:TetR family transcriptional regulator [Frondihabitans sp. PhB188]|uniref:TetR/AcrR family transcriptional regulator n=1 Tax=Frondihabitans sp. PhB188 TaxID=2485200 RepID=UPI000F48F968|nr:helix-turn-helix domain-containing protein [Frondihabitans sp. PhB188]ROQ38725.1 TetR family transcriptional regulator [Frondihabitans sp. PhB188]